MKKFVSKTLIFVLPLVLFCIVAEILLRQIPNDYKDKSAYLEKNVGEIEYLFMGSSHTFYGVDPELVEGNAFNQSHISQSIDWDYELLKKYEGRWSSLKKVYVPIDYFTLFSQISTGPDPWRVKNYSIYYGFFQFDSVSGNSEILSLHLKSNLLRLFSYYVKKKDERSSTELGYAKVNRKQADLQKTGVSAAKRHKRKKEWEDIYKENQRIVSQMAQLVTKSGAEVVFYTSPAHSTYTTLLDGDQLKLSKETVEKLAEESDKVRFLDLMTHPAFKAEDFRDADHLNQSGAKKFTKLLIEASD